MNYKNAYLKMFGMITSLLKQLETMDYNKETLNVSHCLKTIQAAGEEACIAEEPPQ